jgi:hypothetical protein
LGFDVGGRAGTTVSCAYISVQADEKMPKIKKAGGISRFLDAFFYPDNIAEHQRCVKLTGPEKLPLALQDHYHPVRCRNIWPAN